MSGPVVMRQIAATPARSAADAWDVITQLLTQGDGEVRAELDRVGGIAMAMIASEAPHNSPITISGSGPRLRIYCQYNEDAVLGASTNEEPLSWCPTDGDWQLSLPCLAEDEPWASAELARLSNRVTVRDHLVDAPVTGTNTSSNSFSPDSVNVEAFLKR